MRFLSPPPEEALFAPQQSSKHNSGPIVLINSLSVRRKDSTPGTIEAAGSGVTPGAFVCSPCESPEKYVVQKVAGAEVPSSHVVLSNRSLPHVVSYLRPSVVFCHVRHKPSVKFNVLTKITSPVSLFVTVGEPEENSGVILVS